MTHLRLNGIQSHILTILSILSLWTACSTPQKNTPPPSDPVSAQPTQAATTPPTDDTLPPELQNAKSFDPATTLDPQTVKDGDFYQVNKSIQDDKAALDAAWAEQNRIENVLNAAKEETEKSKLKNAKDEEEKLARQRQLEIDNYEKNKDKQNEEERNAADEVKKMPTISDDELNWKALDHH
jgi:type IV secretory pathway VirB10-like protein